MPEPTTTPPADTRCLSLSPESGARCDLDDTAEAHSPSHRALIDGTYRGGGTFAVWATDGFERDRWALRAENARLTAEVEGLRLALSFTNPDQAFDDAVQVKRLRLVLANARPVIAYVSAGRKHVDVDPYPDALARKVNAAIGEVLGDGGATDG